MSKVGQYLVVAVVVLACTVSAGWTLMPGALRRRCAAALVALPWPGPAARWLARQATPAAARGCAGCAASASALAAPLGSDPTPITFHRRPPKRD